MLRARPAVLAVALVLTAVPRPASSQDEPARGSKEAGASRQDVALQLEVNAAIDRGVDFLRLHQHRDGAYTGGPFKAYRAGPTALCAYALAQSGLESGDPCLTQALRYLRAHPPVKTYSAGLTLLLLAELGADDGDALAASTLEKIIEWERRELRGTWGYPDAVIDLSNVQFAALGLWAAHRIGLDVPLDLAQRAVEATAEHFQEEPRAAAAPGPGAPSDRPRRSRSQADRVAGFRYRHDGSGDPHGSMTVAGIAVHRIMQRIHGRRLGAKCTKIASRSEQLAMGWLEENLSFTENPGAGHGHLLYYLWGIERMMAFLEQDDLFGRDWYEEGARHLLGKQRGDGSWDGSIVETSFALLFLARATSGGRAVASGGNGGGEASLLSAEGPIRVRAVGGQDLRAWIEFIDEAAMAAEGMPLHVLRVEWLVGGEVLGTVEGSAEEPWRGERFPWAHEFDGQREVQLAARVLLVDPAAEAGEPGSADDPDVFESRPLDLDLRWRAEDWMREAAAAAPVEGIDLARAEVTASSAAEEAGPEMATDGFGGTAWYATPEDAEPHLTFAFNRTTKVRAVVLAHAGSSVANVGDHAGARRVRVTVNGDEPHEFDLPDQSPAPIELALPKVTRLRTLEVRVLEWADGPGARRGFAEVTLVR